MGVSKLSAKVFFFKVNYSFNNGNFLAHLLMGLHLNSNLTILSVTNISCPPFLLHPNHPSRVYFLIMTG